MSTPGTKSDFESPLLIKRPTEFTAISFGQVTIAPQVAQLQRDLNKVLYDTVEMLPSSLAVECAALLDSYSGRPGDFFSLFYVPVWSFLHWALLDSANAGADLRRAAQSAHAMSLFLHLWDDHLCDGQLETNIARLQLRTTAWQRFMSSAYEVCELAGIPTQIADDHASEYLGSQPNAAVVADIDQYLQRFSRQISIWTLVPRALDAVVRDIQDGNSLQRLIDLFACCWRLIDDIQDTHLDLVDGKENAVWYELDYDGRQRWQNCQTRSRERNQLEAESWRKLSQSIRESAAIARLLSRIDTMLGLSAEIANANGWRELARELTESRTGLLAEQKG